MKSAYLFLIVLLAINLNAQEELKPTLEKILVKTTVLDPKNNPRINEKIEFESQSTKIKYVGLTDKDGKFNILLPKDQTYWVVNIDLPEITDKSQLTLPDVEGLASMNFSATFGITTEHRTFTLRDVYFDTGKASIKKESHKALNDLFELLSAKKSMNIEIAGHTDNIGSIEKNKTLSKQRSESVKKYLVNKGISSKRITTSGHGSSQPVASNSTVEGRKENRRTEVIVVKE